MWLILTFFIAWCQLNIHLIYGQYECTASTLSDTKPPCQNFDLSHFDLIIPNASMINVKELNNNYQSQYFYTDSKDGSMSFYVPGNGTATTNAHCPRSEMRHLCNPSSNTYNWLIKKGVDGLYEMRQTVRADPSNNNEFTFGQIFAFGIGHFMVMSWNLDGKITASYYTNNNSTQEKVVVLDHLTNIYEKFYVYTRVDSKTATIQVYVNNQERLTIDASYWTHYNFFKAGAYINGDKCKDPTTMAIAHEYCLNITLSGKYSCVQDPNLL